MALKDVDYKIFDCTKQTYGNCSCTDTCENSHQEITTSKE